MATHFKGGIALGAKGESTEWTRVEATTVAVNPASIAANTTGDTDVTITGALTTDIVTVHPPSTLEAGLVSGGAWVQSANTVRIRLGNVTAAPIDGASANWTVVLWRQ